MELSEISQEILEKLWTALEEEKRDSIDVSELKLDDQASGLDELIDRRLVLTSGNLLELTSEGHKEAENAQCRGASLAATKLEEDGEIVSEDRRDTDEGRLEKSEIEAPACHQGGDQRLEVVEQADQGAGQLPHMLEDVGGPRVPGSLPEDVESADDARDEDGERDRADEVAGRHP